MHVRAEASALGTECATHSLVQALAVVRARGLNEARAVALARVAIDGEVADAQDLAADVLDREVHSALRVREDAKGEELAHELVRVLFGVVHVDAKEHEQAASDPRDLLAVDAHGS